MIYPGKKKKGMVQLCGSGGEVQAALTGAHRIYSRKDTQKIIEMAKSASTKSELLELGKYVYDATKKQDRTPAQYTEE